MDLPEVKEEGLPRSHWGASQQQVGDLSNQAASPRVMTLGEGALECQVAEPGLPVYLFLALEDPRCRRL